MPLGKRRPFVGAEAVSSCALEFVTQRELHGPWVHRPLELTEGLRRLQAQARIREVRVIKGVESLGSKLQPLPLPGEAKCFGERHIDIKDWRQANRRASAGALGRLILKIAGHARRRENAGDAIAVDMHATGGSRRVHDRQ